MKLYHVTVNGKQVDIAASNIRVAINRGIDTVGLTGGESLRCDATLSNHGEVYRWRIEPVKARTTEFGFFRVQGHEWATAGRGATYFVASPTDAGDRFVKLSKSQDWAPEATHLALLRVEGKGSGVIIAIEGRA